MYIRDQLVDMPPSFLFQQEIKKPRVTSFEIPRFIPKDLAAIEVSLRTNSTIPEFSGQDLRDAAATFRKFSRKLQKTIPDVERYLDSLKVQANQLQTAESVARDAHMRLIKPFPPLPLDVAQQIVSIAAGYNKSTAKSLSVVSKHVYQWARRQLWKSVFIDEPKLKGFITLIRAPRFASANALLIRRLQISQDAELSRENACILLTSLPNLEQFGHWGASEYLTKEDLFVRPSLQRISCDPLAFSSDPDRMDFNSPFFQNLTHLDFWNAADDPSDFEKWNWASLKVLVHLTHLRMNLQFLRQGPTYLSYVQSRITPALPPSLQILILDVAADCNLLSYKDYNKLRRGEVDRRVLLCAFEKDYQGEWVLELGTKINGGEDGGRGWLNGGEDQLWKSGMKMLRKRNNTLGFEPLTIFSVIQMSMESELLLGGVVFTLHFERIGLE
ncbi:hypothetical protein DL96DRAFT_1794295 [Flagelloscypha sp. PMI_526]|nr:hypothetical protein DL96DRAFT_1794295 [Flagelloscypha sp. PMI_526]